MIWPFLCVDNFFYDLHGIKAWAEKLEYHKEIYPGLRTQSLHLTEPNFFEWVNYKILALLYPMEESSLIWNASTAFSLVPPGIEHDGWVHTDTPAEISAIIYLTDQANCGTQIFTPKVVAPRLVHHDKKIEYLKGNTVEDIQELKKSNNEQFDVSVTVKSCWNRLIMFDSGQYHATEPYMNNTTESRLTLVSFFNKIQHKDRALKLHIPEMRRR
jgi:hypothetical protein